MKTARNIRQTKAIFIMSSQQQTCERSCTGQDRNVTTHLDARKRIFLYVTSAFFRNPERMSIYWPGSFRSYPSWNWRKIRKQPVALHYGYIFIQYVSAFFSFCSRGAAKFVTDVLTIFWCLLWSIIIQNQGNIKYICFIW